MLTKGKTYSTYVLHNETIGINILQRKVHPENAVTKIHTGMHFHARPQIGASCQPQWKLVPKLWSGHWEDPVTVSWDGSSWSMPAGHSLMWYHLTLISRHISLSMALKVSNGSLYSMHHLNGSRALANASPQRLKSISQCITSTAQEH
jgi:hypothetical protein